MRRGIDWNELFSQEQRYRTWIQENLNDIDAVAILLGDELNTVHFDWHRAFAQGTLEDHFSVGFIDVNATAYAACSVAVKLFYQLLHEYNQSWIVERLFCPVSDHNHELMKRDGVVSCSAEGHMPAAAFDVLCFSQQMIGDEVNLIAFLQEADIPLHTKDRSESDPFIIRGGASSFNPSLIMDACDLFFFGEGEEVLPPLLAFLEEGMRSGRRREDVLKEAVNRWDCLWAPMFYQQRFSKTGKLLGMFRLCEDVPEIIHYAWVRDLDHCFVLTKPIGDYCHPSFVADSTEITRGCEGQCSFCVSGFTYMPFRARSVSRVLEVLKERLYHSGSDAVALNSFCGASYPWLNPLVRELQREIPLKVRMLSQRIDSIKENPEFAHYLARQGTERIVFGVEGISQKLRQRVSKNYTEEQILETVRMLCRYDYRTVKFMFIAHLPGEGREDYEELIHLTEQIMEICREEEQDGHKVPLFLYSWTRLRIYPFTPFQWLEAPQKEELLPADVAARLERLGVIISKEASDLETHDTKVVQLLCMGDSRLQAMLEEMASRGMVRHGSFGKEAVSFSEQWLRDHGLPTMSEWFQEKPSDIVFPWDFIDNGVSKEHLRRRYESAVSDNPRNFSRCLTSCHNCGACSTEHQKTMSHYRREKQRNRNVSLADLSGQASRPCAKQGHYAIVTFETDATHRVVRGDYWTCELARALNYAGISYDRSYLKVFKPFHEHCEWAVGINTATILLYERYATDELVERINAHTVHMRVTSIAHVSEAPVLTSITYQIPLPEESQESELEKAIRKVIASERWMVTIELVTGGVAKTRTTDLRPLLQDLCIRDHSLIIRGSMRLSPYFVYQELLDLDWKAASRYVAVCTEMAYEPDERGKVARM